VSGGNELHNKRSRQHDAIGIPIDPDNRDVSTRQSDAHKLTKRPKLGTRLDLVVRCSLEGKPECQCTACPKSAAH